MSNHPGITIAGRRIAFDRAPYVIAEMSANHNGSIETAFKIIESAKQAGADAAAVIFDAISRAKARNIDVVLADTAGRLHNKSHLMDELVKMVRVIKKQDASAPHAILLVVDATTGQNAIAQARNLLENFPENERAMCERVLTALNNKAKIELTGLTSVGNINDAAILPKPPVEEVKEVTKQLCELDPKYDWY
jgi:hypothetical protein